MQRMTGLFGEIKNSSNSKIKLPKLWNILFMAPRIKMIVIKTYFGAVVVKRCDVSQQPLQSKF